MNEARRTLPESTTGPAQPSWLQRRPRLALFGWLILLILGLYLVRLWQLQFVERGFYLSEAQEQQLRVELILPQRGVIFDRHGELLVRNVPAYNVIIIPGELPDDEERERAVLQRLSRMIDIPYSNPARAATAPLGQSTVYPEGVTPPQPGLLEMVDEVRYLDPYAPLVVMENVDRELALILAQEGGTTMPGVGVQILPRRSYTTGALTSQVVGFMGKIPPERADELAAQGYDPNLERIGYAGVEAAAEENLRGVPGRRYVRKDFFGKEMSVEQIIEPVPGDNVHLTLDTTLQQVAEDALRAALDETGSPRGVVIALDPRDGQVLSLVSLPTYDNNFFAKGINTPQDFEKLAALNDDPHGPLFNHAIADRVPPGSVFKIVPATGALQEGAINRYTTLNCPGRILLPNKFAPNDPGAAQPFYCWIELSAGHGHGSLNVVDALAQSCDIFFYKVGGGFPETHFEGLGVKRLASWATAFGLGEPTGIDIPGEWEYDVSVPDERWKREVYQESWTTGDTYNMSIGQGFLTVSPLQMTNAMAAVANGGTLYQPQLIHHITDAEGKVVQPFKPRVLRTLEVDDAVWSIVREGLEKAVSAGTATNAQVEGVRVAGKTGTAEYCDNLAQEAGLCPVPAGQTLPTHAWFIAYAPADAPEIVVTAWVYNGGEGSQVTAPIVQKILDYYFNGPPEEKPSEEATSGHP
ncbi:MAG: penicillin-binding protein 2 [Anaerolineae bacterium]